MVALPHPFGEPPECGIKVLDLLTNRYHGGLVHQTSEQGLHIELPAAARLHAGQHVRFSIGSTGVLARRSMQAAVVHRVWSSQGRWSVELIPTAETIAA